MINEINTIRAVPRVLFPEDVGASGLPFASSSTGLLQTALNKRPGLR